MSGRNEIVLGAISFSPAHAPEIIDRMAESIVDLLVKLAEVEAERDFYKAAASKLMSGKPQNGRRKQ
jgi:hypothetical protein